MFVAADESRIEELRALPGVVQVERMLPIKRQLDRAVELVGAPAAWNTLGGIQNAGAGVKIGILDTGIDQTHPAFQDSALRAPAGYPKCQQPDCAYTNNKVIVARSYVETLVYGEEPAYSRPDDVSPRDRVGHGTAAAAVAAADRVTRAGCDDLRRRPQGLSGQLQDLRLARRERRHFQRRGGAGARGRLPGRNGHREPVQRETGDVGPQPTAGPVCSANAGVACDLQVEAVENAVKSGMTVVVSGGNSGDFGGQLPTLNTIYSPGTAPGAITRRRDDEFAHLFFERATAGLRHPGRSAPHPGAVWQRPQAGAAAHGAAARRVEAGRRRQGLLAADQRFAERRHCADPARRLRLCHQGRQRAEGGRGRRGPVSG